MKWKWLVIVALFLFWTKPAYAGDPMVDLFAQHKDFPCVQNPSSVAHIDVLDAFAKQKGLDAERVNCYAFTKWFAEDERRRIENHPLGVYDHIALYYARINQVLYDLGGQDAYRINEKDRPVYGSWVRYLDRWARYVE